MNKKGEDLGFGFCILLVLFILLVGGLFINDFYLRPQASEKANQYCQEKGFDFYEDFERVGLFSNEPVAITCKYVEQYRKIDINSEVIPTG